MPTYDYRCRTCDVRFEVRRGLDDAPAPVDCPQGHGATSRIFTPVAVGAGAAPATGPAGGCCGGGCCG